MPSLVAISQATTEINGGGVESASPGIECFKLPRSDRVKTIRGMHNERDSYLGLRETLRLYLF